MDKKHFLNRYWFTFDSDPALGQLNLGCGVTAYSYEDAIGILKKSVFRTGDLPQVQQCIENIDVSTLDKGHVLPNMGLVIDRGVWFPLGYEQREA